MRVLVVGGGIAGISAARALLRWGEEVIIVEKEEKLGGLMSQIANCRISFQTLFSEIEGERNLHIFTSSGIEEVKEERDGFRVLLKGGEELRADRVIIAAGAVPFEPSPPLFPSSPRVLGSLAFDKILDQRTPELPPDLRRVCFLLCVGSREKAFPLCSGVCCPYTLRQIKWLLQRREDVSVTVLYNDLRLSGQEFFLKELLEKRGVRFFRSSTRAIEPWGNRVRVRYWMDSLKEEEFDYVILSVGLRPSPELKALSRLFGFSLNEHGFVKESSPLATDRKGVFVAGCALEPMNIKDSISTGLGAALRCLEGSGRFSGLAVNLDEERYGSVLEDLGIEVRRDAPLRLFSSRRPVFRWKDNGGPYLFLLDVSQLERRFLWEYLSLAFLERALELRERGERVFVLSSGVLTPSYDELLYERARRKGVIFLDIKEGEEVLEEARTIYRAEEVLESIGDGAFLIQYRSEPQLRFTPHRWDRGSYLFGFRRYPRSKRWEGREFYGALAELLMERYEEITVAEVDEERCSGCEQCLRACPHDAIRMVERRSLPLLFGPSPEGVGFVAQIDEDLCQGGGLCANVCPADAIRLKDEEDLTTSQTPQAAPGAYASP